MLWRRVATRWSPCAVFAAAPPVFARALSSRVTVREAVSANTPTANVSVLVTHSHKETENN